MQYLKMLSNNQEYWNMLVNQAAVTVTNYETWWIIQSICVLLYIAMWGLFFAKRNKWDYDSKDSFVLAMGFVGVLVVFSLLISLGSLSDYNMAKYNPELWALKQIVRNLP